VQPHGTLASPNFDFKIICLNPIFVIYFMDISMQKALFVNIKNEIVKIIF